MGGIPLVFVTDDATYIVTPFWVRVIRYEHGQAVSNTLEPTFLNDFIAWLRFTFFTTRWVEDK